MRIALTTAKMDYSMMQLFLAGVQNKDDTFSSDTHLQKFVDAVKYGQREPPVLPTDFVPQMKSFLDAYKKKYQVARQNGEYQSKQAIPFPGIFSSKMAIAGGYTVVWSWPVWQWQVMCRSVNIKTLVSSISLVWQRTQ